MFTQFIEFLAGIKMTIVSALCLLFSLICLILDVTPFFNPVWLTIFISGVPIVFRAFYALMVRRKMTSPLLITTAMIAAISIDEIFAAGEVALIMAVGEILEDITVDKAKKGIENLLKLSPTQGRKITNDGDFIVDIHQIKKGDILRILPGEIIPADGTIVMGSTSVNQANLTGESLPVDKTVNDAVMAGTLNCFGSIDIMVTAITDTFLQKMITLIEQAQQNKSPTELLIDKLASVLVPTSLLIALATYFLTGEIIRAVTILVVFCPCALVLATPISVISAMTAASKNGILVKSGAALEMMGKVDTFIFDKTGTLTEGNITVTDVISLDARYSSDDILSLTASIEKFSEHPLAKAVITSASEANLTFSSVDDFKMIPGKGVAGIIQGKILISGNLAFLQSNHVSISDEVAENNWTANMKHNMFFINVPVVFSYDFNIASNALLRLGFGVQYQQYLGGKSFCELDGETTSFLPTESHNLKNGSLYGQLLGMYSNAGGLLQLGFLINDVYVGVTYDAFFEGFGNWGYVGTVGARVGYRF